MAHNCATNISAAQAAPSRPSYSQNMRRPARRAQRPPRPDPPDPPAQPDQIPLQAEPPPGEPPPAPRHQAPQQPRPELSIDNRHDLTYRWHRAPPSASRRPVRSGSELEPGGPFPFRRAHPDAGKPPPRKPHPSCPHCLTSHAPSAHRPPQPGHESRPLPRSSSTTAALLPTVSTGASAHPHGPPRTSRKGNGEGRPISDVLTVSSHATSATGTTTKTTLNSNDATTPTTFTLNDG